MVDMVPRKYFISGSVRVLLCNETPGTSSSPVVEGEAVQVDFQNLPYFCRVRSTLTQQLYTVVKLIVSAINNLKTMGGGHAVHDGKAFYRTRQSFPIHFTSLSSGKTIRWLALSKIISVHLGSVTNCTNRLTPRLQEPHTQPRCVSDVEVMVKQTQVQLHLNLKSILQ